jgi:hypothetical protein
MNVIYHPEAEEEMIATVSYYENQADGLLLARILKGISLPTSLLLYFTELLIPK